MAELCLVLGRSGFGKSHSLKNMPSENTFLIQTTPKMLPFKGWKSKYKKITKDNPNGNLFVSDKTADILKSLRHINTRENIKYIFLDDMQYSMINSFMRKIRDKTKGGETFQKYNELAGDYNDILQCIIHELRDDLIVFVASHVDVDDFGNMTIKTVGKLVNEKIKVEGLSSVVIVADCVDGEYVFKVNGEGTQKAPEGMFEEESIPNDLSLVVKAINEFNYGEVEIEEEKNKKDKK